MRYAFEVALSTEPNMRRNRWRLVVICGVVVALVLFVGWRSHSTSPPPTSSGGSSSKLASDVGPAARATTDDPARAGASTSKSVSALPRHVELPPIGSYILQSASAGNAVAAPFFANAPPTLAFVKDSQVLDLWYENHEEFRQMGVRSGDLRSLYGALHEAITGIG